MTSPAQYDRPPPRPHRAPPGPARDGDSDFGHLGNRILTGRAHVCATMVYEVWRETLGGGRPADRLLNSRFRAAKKFGSSDRRMISETLYSVARWWGWVQQLSDDLGSFGGLEPEEAAGDSTWLKMLLAAHLLDVAAPWPAALVWRDQLAALGTPLGMVDGQAGRPLAERAAYLARIFHLDGCKWQDLVPTWLYAELAVAKDQLEPLVESLQRRPPLWLRAQGGDPAALAAELIRLGFEVSTFERAPAALRLADSRINVFEIEAFKAGRFEVQDLASQAIGMICAAKPGERWWDVCAGGGGKSLQLAAQMAGRGTVVATDIREYKLDDLKRRARRGHFHNISCRGFNGHGLPTKGATFDGVLVDAPCTCTGTWRRNPDARWTTTAADVVDMAGQQLQILTNAATGVKPGGILVYATCSLCRSESEEVITRFITAHPEYGLTPCVHPLTGEHTAGMLRMWPHEGDCDATFVARMQRAGT